VVEEHFPELGSTQPEILARHLTEAGQAEDAIEWWSKAGEQARRRVAFTEAIAHLGKAIDLAEGLPDGAERRLARLRLQIAYANARLHARGPGAPESTAAFARAREIAAGTGDAPERFSAYYGLWVSHFVRGELGSMREVAEAALREIGSQPGSSEASMVYRALGMTCHAEGKYADAREHLDQSLNWYNPDLDRGVVWFGVDTAVATMVWLAMAIWPLGELSRARRLADEAVIRARQVGHVPTLVYTHSILCIFEAVRRDPRSALPHADMALSLAREHGMPLYVAIASFFHGWQRSYARSGDAALTEMREGVTLMRKQYPQLMPLVLELLAEAEVAEGRIDDALPVVDEALAEIKRTAHGAYTAEVYRTRGEILLRGDPPELAGAADAFTRAIEIARTQEARMWELRAAASLARLRRDQGSHAEARDLLAPVYGWFTEGFDTEDLKKAKALLDELT
jgi:predicted ATPase